MQASKVELGVISELNNLPRLKTHAAVENVVVDVAEATDVDHERNSSLQEPAELDDQEPLTPIGRMFLEPDLYLCGLCTIGFQNLIDLEELKHTLRNTLVKHKRFSSVVKKNKKGVANWVPIEVDMDALVFEPSGISKADMAAPDFVDNYVSDLATAPPISLARPLWECHVLNGTSSSAPAGNVAPAAAAAAAAHLVFRTHHCLGDGISVMSLLFACTRQTANPEKQPSILNRTRKSETLASSTTPISFLKSVLKMLIFLWNTIRGITCLAATILWLKDSDTVLKGPDHPGVDRQQQKRLVHTIINMDDMRFVKNTVGGTLNDVLLAMVDASLHRYLQGRYHKSTDLSPNPPPAAVSGECKELQQEAHNTKPNEPHEISINVQDTRGKFGVHVCGRKKSSSKVEKLRVRTVAMENIRGSGGLQDLAAMMKKGSNVRWGNCIGFWLFPFSLKHFSDPLDRVRTAMKVSNRIKASFEGRFTFWFGTLVSKCGMPSMMKMLTRREITQTTLLVSNLPGPVEQIMLGNNPIVHMFPVVSGIPQSLCVYMQSYFGKVALVVMSAKHVIPDPEILSQYCIDALQEMKMAAVSLKA